VNLGNGVLVDSTSWNAIRLSKNENSFISALMRALWGRRKLGLKTMKGGAPKHSKVEGPNKKIPMTPAKLNTLLGESLIRNNIFLEKKIQ